MCRPDNRRQGLASLHGYRAGARHLSTLHSPGPIPDGIGTRSLDPISTPRKRLPPPPPRRAERPLRFRETSEASCPWFFAPPDARGPVIRTLPEARAPGPGAAARPRRPPAQRQTADNPGTNRGDGAPVLAPL